MPKKNKSKKKGGAGGSGGGPSGGGGQGFAGSSSAAMDLSYMDVEEKLVEVVYVEPELTRVEWMCPNDRIPKDWLLRCVQDSHIAWHRHFPGSLHPTDLRGRLVPEGAQTFGEIMAGNGLVVVELSGDCVDHGFVGQLAAANANALTMDEKIQSLTEEVATMKENNALMKENLAAMSEKVATIMEKMAVMSDDAISAREWERARDRDFEVRMELQDKVHELSGVVASMKKESILSSKVKKRVALTLAREAVESAIGRVKCDTETWAGYISALSAAEWVVVGVSKQLVKDLLPDGALEFNDSIHNIAAEEVVGSIAGMRHGSLRTAWEDIFFLAFGKRVSDLVFAAEVEYEAEYAA